MLSQCKIRFLGGFRLERGEEIVTRLRSQKTVALLAFLCGNAGSDHGREELVERFWSDSDLDAGRNSLRVALNALRNLLEPPPLPAESLLVTTRHHVRLRAGGVETDVAAFEAAMRARDHALALRLYTGTFLPGFYEEWVIREQERLEALANEAREQIDSDICTPETPALPTMPSLARDNLPLTLTRFFGRDEESSRLEMLLLDPSVRLVTITGPGGTGKTRLAIETARRLLSEKPRSSALLQGGIWFVPLAGLTDARHIPALLPTLLQLKPVPDTDPIDQVALHLAGRRTIFVLDNVEQIADGAATILPALLARLPGVTLCVTSRVRIGVLGERIVALSPLPLPIDRTEPLELLAENPAVALFADRARSVDADFALTVRTASTVAELCTNLEGIPLAIELAAAWVNVLTPVQMNAQLTAVTARLDAFPARRARDREERHRSLRAAIAWSYDLLPADLQRLFARLSVFRGGCSAEAATCIGNEASISSSLARLVQHSFLVSRPGDDGLTMRFTMMESLREFAEELLAPDEAEALAQTHAEYFATLLSARPPAELVPDTDNLRAALAWQESRADRVGSALEFAIALGGLWWEQGWWQEGMNALARVLEHAEHKAGIDDGLVCRGLRDAGALAFYLGDLTAARSFFARQETRAAQSGDKERWASASHALGAVASALGDWDDACNYLEEALKHYRDHQNMALVAAILVSLAWVRRAQGEVDEADILSEEAIALYREMPGGAVGVALCTAQLADSARYRDEAGRAMSLYQESLALFRQAGEPLRIAQALVLLTDAQLDCADNILTDTEMRESLGECLALLRTLPDQTTQCSAIQVAARLAHRCGRLREAARLSGAAEHLRRGHVARLPGLRQRWQALQEGLRSELGDRVFCNARTEGAAWTREKALLAAAAEVNHPSPRENKITRSRQRTGV